MQVNANGDISAVNMANNASNTARYIFDEEENGIKQVIENVTPMD